MGSELVFDHRALKRMRARASNFGVLGALHLVTMLAGGLGSAFLSATMALDSHARSSFEFKILAAFVSVTLVTGVLWRMMRTARHHALALHDAGDADDIEGHLVSAINAERVYWTVYLVVVGIGSIGLSGAAFMYALT